MQTDTHKFFTYYEMCVVCGSGSEYINVNKYHRQGKRGRRQKSPETKRCQRTQHECCDNRHRPDAEHSSALLWKQVQQMERGLGRAFQRRKAFTQKLRTSAIGSPSEYEARLIVQQV